MILELVLLNTETGEPIYQVGLTKMEVLKSLGNEVLRQHADLMGVALEAYKPRTRQPRENLGPEDGEVYNDLNGPVDLG